MRPITMLQSQFKVDTQSGETLSFERCKGGYFSTEEKYGLKVVGKTSQEGIPTPEIPIPIQCVKQGSKIICGNEITVPCDLYEGDIWYPATGKVIKSNKAIELTGSEYWWEYEAVHRENPDLWCYVVSIENKKMSYQSSKCNRFNNVNGAFWGKSENGLYSDHSTASYTYFITNLPTLNDFKEWLNNQKASGDPVILVYKLENAKTEQYEAQYIFAEQGRVNLKQNPMELTADLSATMLIARNN